MLAADDDGDGGFSFYTDAIPLSPKMGGLKCSGETNSQIDDLYVWQRQTGLNVGKFNFSIISAASGLKIELSD